MKAGVRRGFQIFLAVTGVLAGACSSAPKKPLEVLTSRNMASSQLDLANRTANQGRYSDALLILEDARKTAVAVDDPPLLIKTAISRGNIVFALGRHDEAFECWEDARLEAEAAGERDFAAQARIYAARGRLVLLSAGGSGETGAAEEIRAQVNQEIASIKSDDLSRAAGWLVAGMAEKELGRYTEAETSIRKALEIHEKNRYLEEAAYDWYFIGSIRSVSERYDAAVEALKNAIRFDRLAENGFGLASSWQALGEVYLKTGNRGESGAAFRRAAGIYRAVGLLDLAEKAEAKAGQAGFQDP
ncbi:MAG: tetratricopeptide repeat protein [Treponema sp.]|nr:tetratricopeptide repeat protein [Treponema sp.]